MLRLMPFLFVVVACSGDEGGKDADAQHVPADGMPSFDAMANVVDAMPPVSDAGPFALTSVAYMEGGGDSGGTYLQGCQYLAATLMDRSSRGNSEFCYCV